MTAWADGRPYEYRAIVNRPVLRLPGDARLACYIGLNVESFRAELPLSPGGEVPDSLALGLRDYGTRVGVWRLMEIFDSTGVPVTALTNSDVCREHPDVIAAGVERSWCWVAHGQTNSIRMSALSAVEQADHLAEMFAVYDDSLPSRPVGWLGPRLDCPPRTLELLTGHGVRYVLDWCCDDQPVPLRLVGLLAVPYTLEINDAALAAAGPFSGDDYVRHVFDQFEQLLADSSSAARVFALPLHPYIAGQPRLAKHVRKVLTEISATPGAVWCTADEIAAACLPAAPEPA